MWLHWLPKTGVKVGGNQYLWYNFYDESRILIQWQKETFQFIALNSVSGKISSTYLSAQVGVRVQGLVLYSAQLVSQLYKLAESFPRKERSKKALHLQWALQSKVGTCLSFWRISIRDTRALNRIEENNLRELYLEALMYILNSYISAQNKSVSESCQATQKPYIVSTI